MEGNEDGWISETDAVDGSEEELVWPGNILRSNDNGTNADDEDIESEEEGELFTFDVALPVKHAYLGSNLQEARGHTLMDLEVGPQEPIRDQSHHAAGSSGTSSSHGLQNRARGQICQIPILPPYSGVSMALVPGQTLPMTLFHPQAISMLRVALDRGRTFGIIAIRNDSEDEEEERSTFFLPTRRNRPRNIARQFADEDYPLWDVGTTAEIYEFQGEDEDSLMTQDENRILAGFTLKAKGSQRFRLLDIHRQVDGNLLAKVQILPEIILPHPLQESRITCLDHLRHKLLPSHTKSLQGELIYREPTASRSQIEASICSLIKEKRKGDDLSAWERICEVNCLSNAEGNRKKSDLTEEKKSEEAKVVSNISRNNNITMEIEAQERAASLSAYSTSSENNKIESADAQSSSREESSFVNTDAETKREISENVISEKSRTKRERDKTAGFFKGSKEDAGSPPKCKPSDSSFTGTQKLSVRIDRKWCRKRDAALTAWPDWLYNLYDGATLVKRMHQEFKALHLKKREKSMFLKTSLGFKSSEKGIDRSFPCLSNDPVELSFWVVQNLPFDDKQRVKLLRMNSAIQRLRWELGILEKCHRLSCCNCGQKIADQRHAFCMSVAGPQGTYVNPGGYVHEALTLSKTRGLKVVTHPPSTEHSWFPGYAWSIVECSRCTQHMGWLFTVAPGSNQHLRPLHFWGLCRKSLVTGQTKMSEEDLMV